MDLRFLATLEPTNFLIDHKALQETSLEQFSSRAMIRR